jgi:hypothetical protein
MGFEELKAEWLELFMLALDAIGLARHVRSFRANESSERIGAVGRVALSALPDNRMDIWSASKQPCEQFVLILDWATPGDQSL